MDEPSPAASQHTTGTRALDSAAWDHLVQRWTASGAAMMSRFGALYQLRALGGLNPEVLDDFAMLDASVELYIDEVRSAWHELSRRPGAAAPAPRDTDLAASAGSPDFVADLVTDPTDPPATALFLGFIGEASEQGHTRFYVDPALTAFVDVADDAVLLQHEVPAAPGSMGGAYVWLRRDSDIVDRLRTALGDAARMQAEVWDNESAVVVESGVPWATASNVPTSDGVTLSSMPTGTDTSGPDDIPLPAGWPTG